MSSNYVDKTKSKQVNITVGNTNTEHDNRLDNTIAN